MPDEHAVHFTSGTGETVLEPLEPAVATTLREAESLPAAERRRVVGRVAADHPRCLQAWAALAALADDPVESYAFARVGYHRGLDALRAAGWRGSGYVRWRHESNRGFLGSLHALERAAAAIGEGDEEQRCALFLRQLDPEWGRGAEPEGPVT
ncbi:MAG TPA: DUF3151 family protein [Acidimicrobiales bacterium]|nr:DUF3151 family protein [Acidimicrobiales bacterium]